MLATASAGDGGVRGDGDEPHLPGGATQAQDLEDDTGQHGGEGLGELPPPALLVRQQSAADRPVVGAGRDDRRQLRRARVRPGQSGSAHGRQAVPAERTARTAAACAVRRQQEIGNEAEHECDGEPPAQSPGRPTRRSVDDGFLCGRPFGNAVADLYL